MQVECRGAGGMHGAACLRRPGRQEDCQAHSSRWGAVVPLSSGRPGSRREGMPRGANGKGVMPGRHHPLIVRVR